MIPKIIHFCWLSDSPYPKKIRKCIKSWQKHLPDYEFVHWNFTRFPRGKSVWVDQAFDSGKFAFAADYIRLYALYNFGGIYLDTDVEVLKSFNDLLQFPYFIGKENTPAGVEAATLGFEPQHPLIKKMLEHYDGRSFVKDDGTFEDRPLPCIFREVIERDFSYCEIERLDQFEDNANKICILPVDWFSPKHWDTQILNVTSNTYSIHHFTASWKPRRQRFLDRIEGKYGPRMAYYVEYFWRPLPAVMRSLMGAFKRRIARLVAKGNRA